MEKPSPCGVTFYDSNLEAVLVLHRNPVIIRAIINDWRISRLLMDEGSALSLVYLNYLSKKELLDVFIVKMRARCHTSINKLQSLIGEPCPTLRSTTRQYLYISI